MEYTELEAAVRESLGTLATSASEYLPNVAGAALLLVAGWLLAYLLRGIVRRITAGIVARVGRYSGSGELERPGAQSAIVAAVSGAVYWLVLVVFVLAAVQVLALPMLDAAAAALSGYLPNLITAAIVVAVGYLAGGVTRGAISRSARAWGVAYGDVVGRLVQAGVVLVSVIVAIDELGVDNTLLVVAAAVVLAATLGGAAIAFGLGARSAVDNLLAAHYVQRSFRPGLVVRIDGIEGRIIEIGETSVVLETNEGRVFVPARMFGEHVATVVTDGR